MIGLIAAAMLITSAQKEAPTKTEAEDMETCVIANAVRLGGSNTESGEMVIRAAWSRCAEHESDLASEARGRVLMTYYAGNGPRGAEADARELDRMKQSITDSAAAALLESRASQ